MITVLVFISLVLGLNNLSDNMETRREMRREKFHPGQTIYRFEDYMNGKGKIISVRSNGVGYCHPWAYRKLRVPFQSAYKEILKEGEIDSCTGQVFHEGEWQTMESYQ